MGGVYSADGDQEFSTVQVHWLCFHGRDDIRHKARSDAHVTDEEVLFHV